MRDAMVQYYAEVSNYDAPVGVLKKHSRIKAYGKTPYLWFAVNRALNSPSVMDLLRTGLHSGMIAIGLAPCR